MRSVPSLIALTSLIVLLGLAGCASMGDSAPQSKLVDANTLQTGLPAGQAQWPSERWWRRYGDTQLDALIETALRDNPDLHVAEARVRQAQAMAKVADAATQPGGGIDASFTRELFNSTGFIPPPWAGNYDWNNSLTADASYDLDLWGKQRDTLAATIDETRVAEAESQMARLELENRIVRAYLQLALDYTLKDSLEEVLKHRQRGLDITKQRQAAGLATEVQVSQFEAEIPELQTQIEQRAEAITLLYHQLAALTGQGPAAGEAIRRPTLRLVGDAWLQLPATLPANLIGRRPDVAAQRWAAEAAAHEIGAAKAAFYPDINLMAFIGFQSVGFRHFINNDSAVRGIGPAISLPIFDGALLRGNLAARTAGYDIAVERYNATVLHALENVAGALAVAQSAQRQKRTIDAGVVAATKARRLASQGHKAGLTDALVVLNSEVTLIRQQDLQASIATHRLQSYADLMLALGGGLSNGLGSDIPAQAAPRQGKNP